jgi:hypothetical protein
MKRIFFIISSLLFGYGALSQPGKVGINTSIPKALLHVMDSSVVFTGPFPLMTTPGNPPVTGPSVRMMWYADKAAFRVGLGNSDVSVKDSIGNYSLAAGANPLAKGDYSAAIGFNVKASGQSSIALGQNTRSSGFTSMGFGTASNASGDYSFAGGSSTEATAQFGFAFGYDCLASGEYSVALGEQSKATGDWGVAIGSECTAAGRMSVAIGDYNEALADGALALNYRSRARGENSTAINTHTSTTGASSFSAGEYSVGKAFCSFVVGRNNDSTVGNPTQWVSTDPLFVVGNGSFSNRGNAMTVLKNARTGINTSFPLAMLHVKDSSVLFNGPASLSGAPGPTPTSGAGIRMFWYADKAALRAGAVSGSQWDKEMIGNYSTAFGLNNVAASGQSFVAGYNSQALGINSIALGNTAIAVNDNSIAVGNNTRAVGVSSMAAGLTTSAQGDYSFSAGLNTVTKGFAGMVVGMYNDSLLTTRQTSFNSSTPLFIIGNGNSHLDRSNAMAVLKNGRTGINVPEPLALLHLKANEASFNMHIRLENVLNTDYSTMVYDGDMKFRNFGAGDNYQWRIAGGATRMILYESGDLSIDGVLSQSSDARLKKQIIPVSDPLLKLKQLGGYSYYWIDTNKSKELQTGLLAQEVEQVMPELVKVKEDGTKTVNYNGVIAYLVEANKELIRKLETLEKDLQLLKESKH